MKEINFNELRDKAYQCAIEHGWHEEEYSNKHWLCLVIAELMEAVEAHRKDNHTDKKYYEERLSKSLVCRGLHLSIPKEKGLRIAFQDFIKDTVEDELADACIRLFDFAGLTDADLNDIDYENSSTEDYSELTFTESMFKIVKSINDYWEPLDIGFILNEILAFCKDRNIDIMWHIEQKMKYNELRPYKHGNKVY